MIAQTTIAKRMESNRGGLTSRIERKIVIGYLRSLFFILLNYIRVLKQFNILITIVYYIIRNKKRAFLRNDYLLLT